MKCTLIKKKAKILSVAFTEYSVVKAQEGVSLLSIKTAQLS